MNNLGVSNPFAGQDVWQLLAKQAARLGPKLFLLWDPPGGRAISLSYAEVVGRAERLSGGLRSRGVNAGDRVLIHLDNCLEFVVAWFACSRLGAVAVTTNTRSAADELAYFAEHSGSACAITQPAYAAAVVAAPGLRWILCTDHDSGVPADLPSGTEALVSCTGDPGPERSPDPFSPLSVQYTSGTTSRPKGVLWSNANGLWGAMVNARHEALRPEDRHLVYLPLFHTNALSYSLLASLWVGASLVIIPKWSTSRFWEVSTRHGCTFCSLISLSARALARIDAPAAHTYRHFGAGVCDLPYDDRLGVKTIGWWGMTETISHPIVGDPHLPDQPRTMGRPAPEYQVRVVRADGSMVAPGETGELQVRGMRGLSLFDGYLFDEAATEASFDHHGWFATGDLVTPQPGGHILFADRAKDMLRVGAENVAASEVERVIGSLSGVLEAAVVGRPDPKLDEVPVAFVVAGSDVSPEDVIDACRRQLAEFKVPREVVLVDHLPRVTLGKVDKKELRRRAAHLAGVTSGAPEP